MTVFCIAAGLLGIILGYVFHWAIRRDPKPDAAELAALVAILVAGVVITFIKDQFLQCPAAFAWYVIGLFVGFVIFLLFFFMKWETFSQQLKKEGQMKVPFFPFK